MITITSCCDLSIKMTLEKFYKIFMQETVAQVWSNVKVFIFRWTNKLFTQRID